MPRPSLRSINKEVGSNFRRWTQVKDALIGHKAMVTALVRPHPMKDEAGRRDRRTFPRPHRAHADTGSHGAERVSPRAT